MGKGVRFMKKAFHLIMTLMATANLACYGLIYRESLLRIVGAPALYLLLAGQAVAFIYFYKLLRQWTEEDDKRIDAQWR
jgi:hypothetical protein